MKQFAWNLQTRSSAVRSRVRSRDVVVHLFTLEEIKAMNKVVGLISLVALFLAAGCGGSSGGTTPSGLTATTPAAKATIAAVNWNLPLGEPTSLDWIVDWDYGSANTVLSNLCEGLWRQTPDGKIVPGLALSMANPNSTTYVYTMRPGVFFSDGHPMTAEDVAYSLNRHLVGTASYWQLWYANVATVSVTAPLEVTVKLKKPDVLINEMMSTPAGYVGEEAFLNAAEGGRVQVQLYHRRFDHHERIADRFDRWIVAAARCRDCATEIERGRVVVLEQWLPGRGVSVGEPNGL